MSNYIVKNGDTILSEPKSYEEARIACDKLKAIYPNARLFATDQEEFKKGYVATGDAEEVEDKSCAGGACTL